MIKHRLRIGIDPGVKTGFSAWNIDTKELTHVKTLKIHDAIALLSDISSTHIIKVRVEDARKRKWFGHNSVAKRQGAGSVKRDCKMWEDTLKDFKKKGVINDFEMIHPIKGATKLNTDQFKNLTGYQGRTSEHSRDAAMLVFQLNNWL